MNYLLNYLLVGVIFTLIYDLIQKYIVKNEKLQFTIGERILLMVAYPIVIIVTIYKIRKRDE